MARASLAEDAPYFAVVRSARNKLGIQYREARGGETRILHDVDLVPESSIDAASLGFVKLEFSQGGQLAQGWGSADGKEWKSLGSYQFGRQNGSPSSFAAWDSPSARMTSRDRSGSVSSP
jgi:hypothetical protein